MIVTQTKEFGMIVPGLINLAGIEDLKHLVGEYQFYLGSLGPVRIKIWKRVNVWGDKPYSFTQSHHIHTPLQLAPYLSSAPFGDSEESALRTALLGFIMFYSPAVSGGHEPSDEWLIANPNF